MKLSNTEVRTVAGLGMQRKEIMAALQEVAEAEHEMIEVMVSRRGLPEGNYVVMQHEGELYLQQKEEKKDEKAPVKDSK